MPRPRPLPTAAAVLLSAAGLAAAGVPAAAAATGPTAASTTTFHGLSLTRHAHPHVDQAAVAKVLARARDKAATRVVVGLDAPSVGGAAAAAAAAGTTLTPAQASAALQAVQAQQRGVVQAIASTGATVDLAVQYAYNGLVVSGTRSQLAAVAQLKGVSSLTVERSFSRDLTTSVPFLGVPQVWQGRGVTGKGVTIGVIDTGIDYTHADFGGPGTVAAYQSNDRTVIEPGTFPTAKVAGGYDFVGDDYDSSGKTGSPTPAPDPDPLDCNGHGTHVSGIAAGEGVTTSGATFTGPYGPGAYAGGFRVGPGVAPEATLYGLKVFGCGEEATVADGPILQAIDWAVSHHLDVINLSLGSPFSGPDDPEVQALDGAAAAGTLPVVSAGNDGPADYIVGSPSVAKGAISVAAVDSTATLPTAVLSSGGTSLQLQVSNGAPVPTTSAPLVYLHDDPSTAADESLGCAASDYAGTAGKIVVTTRGVCARVDRATLGQAAGAVAVVMVNSSPGFPPIEGPIPGVTIPFLGATPDQAPALAALDGQTVSLAPGAPLPNPTYTQTTSFSSGGPSNEGSLAKPDVAAPGSGITSAGFGTGNGPLTESGTSQASPHVAGVAALVLQAHPGYSPARVHDAIVDTADPSRIGGYDQLLDGAGLVDPDAAVSTTVTASAGAGTSLSFGYLESTGAIDESQTLRVRNTGTAPVTFTTSDARSLSPEAGATVTITPATLTVAPGKDAKVRVTVHVPAGSSDAQALAGAVVLTPSTGKALRVPYLAVARTASAVGVTPHSVRASAAATAPQTLTLTNPAASAGEADEWAWLQHDSGPDTGRSSAADIRDVGFAADPSISLGDGAQGIGVVAVALGDSLRTVDASETDVLLDTTGDGQPDYDVFLFDEGYLTTGSFDGNLASFVLDLGTGAIVDYLELSPQEDTSVVQVPFILSDVGLTAAGQHALTVDAYTFSIFGSGTDSADAPGSFDPFAPAITNGLVTEVPAGGSSTLQVAVDAAALRAHPVLGALLTYPGNQLGGRQSDTVRLR